MRIVLDTNIVVSQAISSHGAPARIITRWQQGEFDVLLTSEILEEYAEALGRPSIQRRSGMTDASVSAAIDNLATFATTVVPGQRVSGVSVDPDDDMFLECALAGRADYIVSGDQHLLALEVFRGIPIVTSAVLLLILDDQPPT